ncbi:MAG: zf-HC2 domain-containing protein [bacterium]|nr:MAG: zf-HC2 domain-containing protein [bacterium]
MRCTRVHSRLMAYHDGELSPAVNRRVGKHLESCAECRALLEGLRLADRAVGKTGGPTMPSPEDSDWQVFTVRVMDRVEEDAATVVPVPEQVRAGRPAPVLRWGPALAIVLVVVVSAGVLMKIRSPMPVPEAPPTLSDASRDEGTPAAVEGEYGPVSTSRLPMEERLRRLDVGEPGEARPEVAQVGKDAARETPLQEPTPMEKPPAEKVVAERALPVTREQTGPGPEPGQDFARQPADDGIRRTGEPSDVTPAGEVKGIRPSTVVGETAPGTPVPVAQVAPPASGAGAGGKAAVGATDPGAVREAPKADEGGSAPAAVVKAEALPPGPPPPVKTGEEDAAADLPGGALPRDVEPSAGSRVAEQVGAEEKVEGGREPEIRLAVAPALPERDQAPRPEEAQTAGRSAAREPDLRLVPFPGATQTDQLEYAKKLAEVRKFWESEQILRDLLSQGPPSSLEEEASLLLVKALVSQNRLSEARQLLDGARKQFPASQAIQTFRLQGDSVTPVPGESESGQ